jgi:ligand-binding sensor domain-containing protein/two-component sensor histidine kinase
MASFFPKHLYIRRGQSEQSIMLKHRWTLRLAWLWLGVFSVIVPMMGATTDSSNSPFMVDSLSNEQGLPQSSVISVIQTRDGYLWLGTLNGLVRFDGKSFTRFNVNNTPGLPGNRIVFLFEDSRNILWAGTESAGLCAIQNGAVKHFDTGGPGGEITCAFEDETGAVWFSTVDGRFFYWKDGKLDLQPPAFPAELFYRVFHMLVAGKNGVTWQLQNGQVKKFRGGKLEKDFGATPWAGSFIIAQYKTSDGTYIQFPFDANVTAACEDHDGNLVVGTHGAGIYWFDAAGGYSHISTDKGLSHGIVLSLCFDNEGNLWAGTDGDGIERIRKKTFDAPPGLSGGVAQSVAEDAQGGFWVAFNSGGLVYSLTNSTRSVRIGGKGNAWSVLVDSRQQVWAGTRDEGLFRFVSGDFQPVAEAAKIGPQIYALFQSRDGKLWVGGQNGLGCYDGQDWKFFPTGDGLPPDAVRAIAEGTNGNLWIGTGSSGLFSLNHGKISAAAVPVKDISCLLVDRDDVLWAGTSGHGLARFAQGRWTNYAASDGLASDDIGYLIGDDFGNLWTGSYEGLMRVRKKSLNDFADGKINSISCRTFVETDGLPTRECTAGSQPAAIHAHDGKLFFPTTKGLVSVNPAELKPNSQPPPVMIESVLVDDAKKTNRLSSVWSQAIVIPPGYEQLEIDYTALNFSAPDAVRFKCWLEGYEARPKDVGGERVVSYPKLPPGNYRFHVYAANEDGVWNETGASLQITVQPWFWQTNWFRVAAIIFLLGIIIATVRYVTTQKLKREKQLHDQQEHERARIARDLHDQLGANLTQVALLGEMAEADKNLPGEIELHAQQISHTARETTRSLDEIVWAVNPSNDTLEGLANYACKYAQEYLALAGIRYRADVPTQLPATDIPPDVRHNVFLAFKEAVNNVVKHAHASEAWIRLRLAPEKFILEIEDNGRGLGDVDSKAAQMRNGLRNMKKRMEDIRGEFSIAPGANGGTIVRLTVPIILTTDKHG